MHALLIIFNKMERVRPPVKLHAGRYARKFHNVKRKENLIANAFECSNKLRTQFLQTMCGTTSKVQINGDSLYLKENDFKIFVNPSLILLPTMRDSR